MDIHELRQEYTQAELGRKDLQESPFKQFEFWFQQACNADLQEPNAMVLATASSKGEPLVRTVLLKYFDYSGFVFFTNYESRKARQIEENPHVSLLFLWLPLQRQVQITGIAQKVSTVESLQYFLSRPKGSQLGAWSSRQSSVISSRQLLINEFEKMKHKFQDGEIPLPSFWGGYRVVPKSFEFWQGRPNRLHDRFLYTHQSDEAWEVHRLSP
ncbi:pyridoxamine 5'-phosphate oxidase [Tumidithrix elongata RA019]|uniref:Pyridoxine/pyridoxamine 5'-phosphate oxidase n=1 Tax=Tumidithrix elongata BACA0141 TaxID=2716417 RepID=A0AAW9PQK4_9CYAN|nr:pyridoxamine 5'-phosphate oxidase [Tumidithrix elongata RA019]